MKPPKRVWVTMWRGPSVMELYGVNKTRIEPGNPFNYEVHEYVLAPPPPRKSKKAKGGG